jgi:hypothetical protein
MHNQHLQQKFWDTLFNEDEHTCFAATKYSTATSPVALYSQTNCSHLQYFSINAHNPGTTRAKANVISYRNFLVEFDEVKNPDGTTRVLTKREQGDYILASEIPVSTIVWSGGKSLHVIVSLETPLSSQEEYDFYSKWVHSVMSLADKATKDCARLSRIPGGTYVNKTTNTPTNEQALLVVKSRISNATFFNWLNAHPHCKPKQHKPRPALGNVYQSVPHKSIFLRYTTKNFHENGAPDGEWNTSIFAAACDLFTNGFTLAEAINYLSRPTGELDGRDLATIQSAEKTINKINIF